jgi:hypothetical protein
MTHWTSLRSYVIVNAIDANMKNQLFFELVFLLEKFSVTHK